MEKGKDGSDFVLSDTFKAMHREIKALKSLNDAVEREPLKSKLAEALSKAATDETSADMQKKLMAKFAAKREKMAKPKNDDETKGTVANE